jgi:gamma-glutamyl hercynylcysteine S-oxide synthase
LTQSDAKSFGSGGMNGERGELSTWVRDARERTLDLVQHLSDEQLLGPRLAIVNPLRWELGHLGWFQEHWVLRHALGHPPLLPNGDALYDSAKVHHDTRWDLPLPSRAETIDYLAEVQARVLRHLEEGALDDRLYFVRLAVFHEDMHDEAFLYTHQTHGWPAPFEVKMEPIASPGSEDLEILGGTYELGAREGEHVFVFDNEKWAHPVEVATFRIARAPVTQLEVAEFVHDGGYDRRELWTEEGWRWKNEVGATMPVHWRARGDHFDRRVFDRWLPLEPHLPALHVCAYEAEAWCAWKGRRLPTEAEWEIAAERLPFTRRVWEWTASRFGPYPGFVADPYREYSEPWFDTHRVLRGGCFVTQPRLLRKTWRNFYPPDRRDVWAGFRTCAS